MRLATIWFLSTAIGLSGCMNASQTDQSPRLSDEEKRQQEIAQYLRAEQPDKSTPVVRSTSTMAKYASLFRDACLTNFPDFDNAPQVFSSSGMRAVDIPAKEPEIVGYLDPNNPVGVKMPDAYLEYAKTQALPDGKIPFIVKFRNTTYGGTRQVFTDGVAVAEISTGRRINDSCSVRIKTTDDDPVLAQVKRVVNETGLATGAPRSLGLFGTGYSIGPAGKAYVTVGRQKRSSQSPTRMTALILNKR